MSSNLKNALIEFFLLLPSLIKKRSRWSDSVAFYINRREIAHFDSENTIDIRITKKIQKNLSEDQKKFIDFRKNQSDWIQIVFKNQEDVNLILDFMKLAIEANNQELNEKKFKVF